MKTTIEFMKEKLMDYWVLIESHATICMILDPRFKCDFISNKSKKKTAVHLFETLFAEYQASNSVLSRQDSNETTTIPGI